MVSGVQRIRCYPFANHLFWKRNIFDTVFFRPPVAMSEDGSEFQLPRDREHLEYGKVLLLFNLRLPGDLDRSREVSCAFVKYYDRYQVRGTSRPMCD
jgi:hypothetical protein